jgi:phage-related protein
LQLLLKVYCLIKKLCTTFIEKIPYIVQTIANIICDVLSSCSTVIIYIINLIPIQAMLNILYAIFNVVKTIVNIILNIIFDFINAIFNCVYRIISMICNIIYNFIHAILNSIYSIISTILNTIYNFISMILNGIYSIISTILNTIYNFISMILSGIYNIISIIVTTIIDSIIYVISKTIYLINECRKTIRNIVYAIVLFLWNWLIKPLVWIPLTNLYYIVKNIVYTVYNLLIGSIRETFQYVQKLTGLIYEHTSNIYSSVYISVTDTMVMIKYNIEKIFH